MSRQGLLPSLLAGFLLFLAACSSSSSSDPAEVFDAQAEASADADVSDQEASTDDASEDGGAEIADTGDDSDACKPSCDGLLCGDDGCGGSCGACENTCTGEADDPQLCVAGQCEESCCPDCNGKSCGGDGCGGTCGANGGACAAGSHCDSAGICQPLGCADADCALKGAVCDPGTGLCVECLSDSHCPSAYSCVQRICVAQICPPGERRCREDGRLETCAGDGLTWIAASCGPGETCANGACLPLICEPGSASCEGSLRRLCDETGTAWIDEDCAPVAVCKLGACRFIVCEPDEVICAGQNLAECSADGTKWQYENCQAGTYCDEGACHLQVCTPGERSCTGVFSHRYCNAAGAGTFEEDCAPGTYCDEGACVAQECIPGEIRCTDTRAYDLCIESGADWQSGESCELGAYCADSGCHPQICEPETIFCKQRERWLCDTLGADSSFVEDCATSGQACVEGACVDVDTVAWRVTDVSMLSPTLRYDAGEGSFEVNEIASAWIVGGLGVVGEIIAEADVDQVVGGVAAMRLGAGVCVASQDDVEARICGFDDGLPIVHAENIQVKDSAACALSPDVGAPCIIGEQSEPGEVSLLTVDLDYEMARVAARFEDGGPSSPFDAVLDVFIAQQTVLAQHFELPGLDLSVTLADLDIVDAPDLVDGVLGWWFRFQVTGEPVERAPGVPQCYPGEERCDGDATVACDLDGGGWTPLVNCADDGQACVNGGCVGLVEQSWRASNIDVLSPSLSYDFGQGLVSVNSLVSALLSALMGSDGNDDFLFQLTYSDELPPSLLSIVGGAGLCADGEGDGGASCAFAPGAPLLSVSEDIVQLRAVGEQCHQTPALNAPCFAAYEDQGGLMTLLGIEAMHRAARLASVLPLDGSGQDTGTFLLDVFMAIEDLEGHDFQLGGSTIPLKDLLDLALQSELDGVQGYWFTATFDAIRINPLSNDP